MPNKCHLCTKPASSADGKLVCMGADAKVHAGTKVAPEWLKVCRTCAPPRLEAGRVRDRFKQMCMRATTLATDASRQSGSSVGEWHVHDSCRKTFNKGPTISQQKPGTCETCTPSASNAESYDGMYGRDSKSSRSGQSKKMLDPNCALCSSKVKAFKLVEEGSMKQIRESVGLAATILGLGPKALWVKNAGDRLVRRCHYLHPSEAFNFDSIGAAEVHIHHECKRRFLQLSNTLSKDEAQKRALLPKSKELNALLFLVVGLLKSQIMIPFFEVVELWHVRQKDDGHVKTKAATIRAAFIEHCKQTKSELEVVGGNGGGKWGGYYVWTLQTGASHVQLLAQLLGAKEERETSTNGVLGIAPQDDAAIEYRKFLLSTQTQDLVDSSDDVDMDRGAGSSGGGATHKSAAAPYEASDAFILANAAGILRRTLFYADGRDSRDCYLPDECTIENALTEIGGPLCPAFLYQLFTGEYMEIEYFWKDGGPVAKPPSECCGTSWYKALNQSQNLHTATTGRPNPKQVSLGVRYCYIHCLYSFQLYH